MPELFREPKHNGDDEELKSPQLLHLPCIILIDTSAYMHNFEAQINNGLKTLVQTLKEDPPYNTIIEVCIIGFGDEVEILKPFGPMDTCSVPLIQYKGRSNMYEALEVAMSEMERRKMKYQEEGIMYFLPRIYLLTAEKATDADGGTSERFLTAQARKRFRFFPVAVGKEVDSDLLKRIQIDGVVLKALNEDFEGAFSYFLDSMITAFAAKPFHSEGFPQFPDPKKYNLIL